MKTLQLKASGGLRPRTPDEPPLIKSVAAIVWFYPPAENMATPLPPRTATAYRIDMQAT